MDILPIEIIIQLLAFVQEEDAPKNFRSTCRKFYQLSLAAKKRFIIKSMPIYGLESLPKLLSSSYYRIELVVRSPTLAMQGLSDSFLDTLAGVSNLTGLDITPLSPSSEKLQQLTFLEQLSISNHGTELNALSRLTKLVVTTTFTTPSFTLWQCLTSLRDLNIRHIAQEFLEVVPILTALTRLHFGFNYDSENYNHVPIDVNLVSLSNLKDLNISTNFHYTPLIRLTASTTRLESLWISDNVIDIDINWVTSNTQLTKFHLRYDDEPKFHFLTKLRNISTAKFSHREQLDFFNDAKLKELEATYVLSSNKITHFTTLESLIGVTGFSASTLVNLTQLTIYGIHSDVEASILPTTLKVLTASMGNVANLHNLTQLESLQYDEQFDLSMTKFKAEQFSLLTRLSVVYNDASEAQATLPKLSNLFSLRDLHVFAARTWDNINTDFLTTLTNLERLDMKHIPIDRKLFKKVVLKLTHLTELCVYCKESSGKSLSRLTNLQVVWFASAKPSTRLRPLLEEKLWRLANLQITCINDNR
jgi:hypothetical protein